MNESIDILLATYNGERFLEEQILSILNQTYTDIQILVYDDHSNDDTSMIIDRFAKSHPELIKRIPSQHKYGSSGSFSHLLEHSTSKYIMFADQDDVWLPTKVEQTFNKMKEIEKIGKPALVHSDLRVVNAKLKEVNGSFWNYSCLFPSKASTLNRLLVQNVITGCSMMINRSLLEKAYPIPEEALQHDWWMGLVAAAFGEIGIVEQPTLLYRQHGGNSIGAKKYSAAKYFWTRMRTPLEKDRAYRAKNILQAKTLLQRYEGDLANEQREMLGDYCQLIDQKFIPTLRSSIKHGFCKNGFSRNAIGLIPKGILRGLWKKSVALVKS